MSAQWNDEQTRILIDERKNGNEVYHRTPNRNKKDFWEDIANEINRVNNTNYFTGEDCNKKFLTLTRAYYVSAFKAFDMIIIPSSDLVSLVKYRRLRPIKKLWQVLRRGVKRRREVLLENIITKSSLQNFGKNPVFIL